MNEYDKMHKMASGLGVAQCLRIHRVSEDTFLKFAARSQHPRLLQLAGDMTYAAQILQQQPGMFGKIAQAVGAEVARHKTAGLARRAYDAAAGAGGRAYDAVAGAGGRAYDAAAGAGGRVRQGMSDLGAGVEMGQETARIRNAPVGSALGMGADDTASRMAFMNSLSAPERVGHALGNAQGSIGTAGTLAAGAGLPVAGVVGNAAYNEYAAPRSAGEQMDAGNYGQALKALIAGPSESNYGQAIMRSLGQPFTG